MDVYGIVQWLRWILLSLSVVIDAYALWSWVQARRTVDSSAAPYQDLQIRPSQTWFPKVRFAGLWGLSLLWAGLLLWLLGLDTPAGWWALIGGLVSVLALSLVLWQGKTVGGVAQLQRYLLWHLVFSGFALVIWVVSITSTSTYVAHTADLRHFDPDAVARLETDMWRSYYDKRPLLLFRQLRELMTAQYHFPRLSSFQEAYLATRAAFVFKKGKERSDYEKALPFLQSYYEEIRRIGNLEFDPKQLAALELEWWIVHRQEDRYSFDDLAAACARLMAETYRVDISRVMEHGRLRAEAMKIRDRKAQAGGLTDQDWIRIEMILKSSYHSLHAAIQECHS